VLGAVLGAVLDAVLGAVLGAVDAATDDVDVAELFEHAEATSAATEITTATLRVTIPFLL
jgi:hypothetical protein